jgi:hypothetical protein
VGRSEKGILPKFGWEKSLAAKEIIKESGPGYGVGITRRKFLGV